MSNTNHENVYEVLFSMTEANQKNAVQSVLDAFNKLTGTEMHMWKWDGYVRAIHTIDAMIINRFIDATGDPEVGWAFVLAAITNRR